MRRCLYVIFGNIRPASLNIHLHCLVLDGVYRSAEGEAVFHEARASTAADLQGVLVNIISRIQRLLTRLGLLIEEQGMSYLADIDPDNPLWCRVRGCISSASTKGKTSK